MIELQTWTFSGSEVRTATVNGEPWWVLKDVCKVLEIKNHKEVPDRLEPDEVGRFDLPHPQNPDKTLEMVFINESGLYSVILRSDKPQAKPLRKWVTGEVLPSIRKTGAYAIQMLSKSDHNTTPLILILSHCVIYVKYGMLKLSEYHELKYCILTNISYCDIILLQSEIFGGEKNDCYSVLS